MESIKKYLIQIIFIFVFTSGITFGIITHHHYQVINHHEVGNGIFQKKNNKLYVQKRKPSHAYFTENRIRKFSRKK